MLSAPGRAIALRVARRGGYALLASRTLIQLEVNNLKKTNLEQKELDMASLYDFEMKSITGESVALSQYDGQVCLIVNLASE